MPNFSRLRRARGHVTPNLQIRTFRNIGGGSCKKGGSWKAILADNPTYVIAFNHRQPHLEGNITVLNR